MRYGLIPAKDARALLENPDGASEIKTRNEILSIICLKVRLESLLGNNSLEIPFEYYKDILSLSNKTWILNKLQRKGYVITSDSEVHNPALGTKIEISW